MNNEQLMNAINLLESERSSRDESKMITSDERIRYYCMHMNLQMHLGNYEEAMADYNAGLAEHPSLTKTKKGALTGLGNGSMQYMHLHAATIMHRWGKPGAEEYIKRLDKEGKDHTYFGSVNIKNIVLQQTLGIEVGEEAFREVDISAGKGMK